MVAAIPVGLVGAGSWAERVHAPMIAAGPETSLVAVWARRFEAAKALADTYGAQPFDDYDAFLAACEAVDFAVAPEAQPDLAIRAARAGKPLLLEKPLGATLEAATAMAEAIKEAGVPSLLTLTYRFIPGMDEFISSTVSGKPIGARATFLAGYISRTGSPWRQERGALLDVGPHTIDLVSAVLGPAVRIVAHGDSRKWVGLLLDHEGGGCSQIAISPAVTVAPPRVGVEAFGPEGSFAFNSWSGSRQFAFGALRHAFATAVRTDKEHPLNAQHGLYLQRLVHLAEQQLADRQLAPH